MSAIPDATEGSEILATWGQAVADWSNDRTSITAATGDISTTQTRVIGTTIPANGLIAGTTYRIVAYGTADNTGASARALTLRVRCGPTTLTGNIAGERIPNILSTANGEGFRVEFTFTVRTAGASGTCIANGQTSGSSTAPLNSGIFVSNTTSTVAVDTTVANVLELTAVTGHASATANFTVATIERLTP